MEEGDESLFSLELLVESARVEPRLLPTPVPAVGPFRPAVALRLLDFPTLLVRAPQAGPGPLVPFGRGKSCLFRLRPDALRGLLRRSPLHALLLALPPAPAPGPARLLGSCSVSLAEAAEELLLDAGGPGGRRGHFALRDLMGEPVGELALSYRLSNLGPCLLGHLGEGAAGGWPPREKEEAEEAQQQQQQLPPKLGTQSKGRLGLELIPEGEEEQDLAPEPFSPGSFSSGQIEPSSDSHGKPSSNSHRKSPPHNRRKPPPDSNMKPASHRHPKPPSSSHTEPPLGQEDRELDIEANVFCPPPMYYSCPPENPQPRPKSKASVIMAVPAAQESFPDEGAAVLPAVPLVKEEPTGRVQEVTSLPQASVSPEQLRQNLSQLPLLNALLVELSLLNSPSLQPQPSSVHPQLAWLYQNAEGRKSPPPCAKNVGPCCEEKKATSRKERGRSNSPKLKRNRTDRLKCSSPSYQFTCPGKAFTKMAYVERIGSPEKNNAKENSPPRRKLTYGLTNTLRLRLQRSNPAMLKVHEKREHRRKKQGELVEKKGKTSSAKGKLLRGSPEHHPKSSGHFDEKSIPDQKTQINENVETLIQSSVDQDCPTTQKSADYVVKNSDDGKQKDSSEMIASPCKEKSLKVHLPRVFLQDAEALENKIDTEVEKSIEHNDCDVSVIHNNSQTNNLENSHELKNSDDMLANSDNPSYSEDFTSADSSGQSLECRESSLDPLLGNQDESHSVMDSSSKISGRSLTAESISPPLPVPSAASPVQSLKKTCELKSNAKNTGVFNKLVDDSPPGTLQEEVATQHTGKEESKQTLKNKEVCSDLNCRIAKGQSVEKSSSLRTSQVSSYLPSNVSDLDLSGLEESKASEKEKEDDFAMLGITNQCRHISELVVNKLPGYTM